MEHRDYSHVSNFTDYMAIVYNIAVAESGRRKILDIPAGNGLLAERLTDRGHEVVCADINRGRPDYVYADMEDELPFEDEEFDTVVCMEGLEHVINPTSLISELCRVCNPGGCIIISLPNIQNCYSRLVFLFTGNLYQFSPEAVRHREGKDMIDRGHVSPLGYFQLRYLFRNFGAQLIKIDGDRYKKKILIPIYLFIIGLGRLFERMNAYRNKDPELKVVADEMFSRPALFSRSLIMVFEKIQATDTS